MLRFQSTPPACGATWLHGQGASGRAVSIHAPRVGGDTEGATEEGANEGFNPRPPRGGRRHPARNCYPLPGFNPRPPRGGRRSAAAAQVAKSLFQSTPPAWGATRLDRCVTTYQTFQSTPPAWGATPRTLILDGLPWVSIHAPRVGGDVEHAPFGK